MNMVSTMARYPQISRSEVLDAWTVILLYLVYMNEAILLFILLYHIKSNDILV